MNCDKKVLIVDDDSSVLQLYRQLLGVKSEAQKNEHMLSELMSLVEGEDQQKKTRESCDVTLVDQGEAAVEEIQGALQSDDPFQLLFLDMRLPPGMDGKETAVQVRRIQPKLPIVFVTAFSDHSEQTLKTALPTAPIYFNYKPFARLELESAIQNLSL
ncbi:MAG: response regulator [Gammaproteobacteria bacterium]|nr:response regulator [Gammaproteobacteria bacterium]